MSEAKRAHEFRGDRQESEGVTYDVILLPDGEWYGARPHNYERVRAIEAFARAISGAAT